jgi:hypothetical protein
MAGKSGGSVFRRFYFMENQSLVSASTFVEKCQLQASENVGSKLMTKLQNNEHII